MITRSIIWRTPMAIVYSYLSSQGTFMAGVAQRDPDCWLFVERKIKLWDKAFLHLLSVCFQIQWRVLVFTFKISWGESTSVPILKQQVPDFVQELLMVSCRTLKTKGDQVFEVVPLRIWGGFRSDLGAKPSENTFENQFKIHLLRQALHDMELVLTFGHFPADMTLLFVFLRLMLQISFLYSVKWKTLTYPSVYSKDPLVENLQKGQQILYNRDTTGTRTSTVT